MHGTDQRNRKPRLHGVGLPCELSRPLPALNAHGAKARKPAQARQALHGVPVALPTASRRPISPLVHPMNFHRNDGLPLKTDRLTDRQALQRPSWPLQPGRASSIACRGSGDCSAHILPAMTTGTLRIGAGNEEGTQASAAGFRTRGTGGASPGRTACRHVPRNGPVRDPGNGSVSHFCLKI